MQLLSRTSGSHELMSSVASRGVSSSSDSGRPGLRMLSGSDREPPLPYRLLRGTMSRPDDGNQTQETNATEFTSPASNSSDAAGVLNESDYGLLMGPDPIPFWLTTLVVKGLPVRTTQETLLHQWQPDGSYNFLFQPYSVKQRRHTRYAFVNFVSAAAAQSFYDTWHGQLFPGSSPGSQRLQISEARVQGLCPNLWHHRDICDGDVQRHQPAVWQNGRRIELAAFLRELNQKALWAQPWQGEIDELLEQWRRFGSSNPNG